MKLMLCVLSSIWANAVTDQQRCEAEARYCVENRIFGKHVGKTIGRFEGVGYSRGGIPTTCVPQKWKGYKQTGDATAVSDDGIVVRVRSWR